MCHDALVDDGSIAELRRLQARAYAPGADIRGDEQALRRLEQLEEVSRAGAFTAPQDDEPSDPVDPTPPGELLGFPVLASPDAEPEPRKRGRRLIRRWIVLLWPASILVVAVIVGAAALSVAPRAPLTPEAHHVGTIRANPDFVWPGFLDEQGDPVGFHDFHGLTAVAMDGALWGDEAQNCFILMETEKIQAESDNFNGQIYSACGAGPFRATIQIVVTAESLPATVLDRFPEGSALQFVLDDSRIDVYSDAE
jgi:hypothetical protein